MSVSHTSISSQGTPRRVLGDLTPKALNTSSRRADPSESTRAQSPLKQMQTLSPQLFGGKENALSSAPHGKKRSIHEVDDAERVEDAKIRAAANTNATTALSAAAVRLHTDNTITNLPIPGSPTERNTPTPEPEAEPEVEGVSQETQGSQGSFSALINYELCASQNTVLAPPSRAPSPPSPEEQRKLRADLLRTRLGFGIYKVKTNQVEKRSTEIIATWESSFSDSTDASASMTLTSFNESRDEHRVPNINRSPARRDPQPAFITANLDPFRPIGKLTPAPILLPPTTSSRIVHDYDMPSSPPPGETPKVISPAQLRSPTKQRQDYTTPVNQSPRSQNPEEDSRDGSAQSGIRKMQRFQEGDLTSSAVKGNAAKGLMQLMAGKR